MTAKRFPSRRSTRSVTLAEVAAHAGVSAQTVSRAIRQPGLVSEATVERVLASIRATGYVPNLAASHLASNRSNAIAVLIPTVSASVFADMVQGLDQALSPRGYHLLIGTTGYRLDREEEVLRAFLGRRPDGIVLAGTVHTEAARGLLAAARIPVIETWELAQDPVDSVVGFSNHAAMSALMDHVCRLGYRRPVLAGQFPPGDVRALRRRAAFEEDVARQLPDAPLRVFEMTGENSSLAIGADLFERVRREAPDADLVMFTSDAFAAGAILAANRRGIRVPHELGITGFGGYDLGAHVSPQLATVSVPSAAIGERAGHALIERIGANGRMGEPVTIDVGYTLVPGESVAHRGT